MTPNCFDADYHVAQVRVVFKLPNVPSPHLQSLQLKHLAYVEWFSPL